MNLQLRNKVVLVSGGAKGIGAACSRQFLQEGARVAIVDRDEEAGKRLVEQLASDDARFIGADLCEPAACERVVQEVVRDFGQLDSLINNAGLNDAVSLDRSPEEFLASLKLNLVPAFSLTHYCVGELRKNHGSIVNLGSKVAVTGQGGTSGYAAAKGGINALTREWAAALAGEGVCRLSDCG